MSNKEVEDKKASTDIAEQENTSKWQETTPPTGEEGGQAANQDHGENKQKLEDLIRDNIAKSQVETQSIGYAKLKQENRAWIEQLSQDADDILVNDESPRLEGHYYSGVFDLQKSLESNSREKATGYNDRKDFLRQADPQEKSVEIVICLDNSYSMSGVALTSAKQAVVIIGEMANELAIPWGLLSFNDSVKILKLVERQQGAGQWEEEFLDLNSSGGTDDYAALTKAAEMLEGSRASKRIILFLTDGGGNNKQAKLVEKIHRELGFWVMGIGIGPGTDYVLKTYDRAARIDDIRELPESLANLLLDFLNENETWD